MNNNRHCLELFTVLSAPPRSGRRKCELPSLSPMQRKRKSRLAAPVKLGRDDEIEITNFLECQCSKLNKLLLQPQHRTADSQDYSSALAMSLLEAHKSNDVITL